jgi:hypothetical protein
MPEVSLVRIFSIRAADRGLRLERKSPSAIAFQQDCWVNERGGTAVAIERRYMAEKGN